MSEPQNFASKAFIGTRLPAIDAMRGIVMVLMALDHASHAFNAGRYARDSFLWYRAGSAIPEFQFLIRWVTHLCAPTFLFLAGFGLALSIARKQARGVSDRSIDADIIKRGIFILMLEPLWMSFGFGEGILLQVLYSIGASLCVMVLLRRVGIRILLVLCLGIFVFSEGLAWLAMLAGGGHKSGLIGTLFFTGGSIKGRVFVLYPLIPWLAFMLLGWVCGKYMLGKATIRPIRFFLIAGAISLSVFFIVRGINQYGNMLLYRYDNTILQWLHVSKYPPSLTFSALELGLMFLILALLFFWYGKRKAGPKNPLHVFGRTPLLFYILHVHMLSASARLLKMYHKAGLTETFIATLAVLLVLYPLCRWYANVKQTKPDSLLRYL